MDLTINGQPANITLEKEESIGELLSGIEKWIEGTAFCLSGITIDGTNIGPEGITQVFPMKLQDIRSIDIKTSNWIDLYHEALMMVIQYLDDFDKASFADKKTIQADWAEGAAASFIRNRETLLFSMLENVFSGNGLSPGSARTLISERLRELENPMDEIGSLQHTAEEIARRLEDLPLDMQTGKDQKVAETIGLFSGIVEKLFRIVSLLESQGARFEKTTIDKQTFPSFIKDFSTALQELISAYESRDSVLVGDLAEYELAPRLRLFYHSVNNPVLFTP